MTRLVLVRHGQTDWNLEGRYQGHTDLSLNNTGRAQASILTEELKGWSFKAIYSSDLRRASETADIIARGFDLDVQLEPRLREVNLGEWEGMLVNDIVASYPDEWERRRRDPVHSRPPGGESASELSVRVSAAVDEIARRYAPGPVLVVSHGLALAAVLCRAQGIRLTQIFNIAVDNAHPIEVDWPCK